MNKSRKVLLGTIGEQVLIIIDLVKLINNNAQRSREMRKLLETSSQKRECCVCYKNEDLTLTFCGHWLCLDCYNKVDEKCPICRSKFKFDHSEHITKMFNMLFNTTNTNN